MTSPSSTSVVRFLGLSAWTRESADGAAVFDVGLLYPYSRDLQRVCARFDDASRGWPETTAIMLGEDPPSSTSLSAEASTAVASYRQAVAALYRRVAFAGPALASVGRAYARVGAIAQRA